jgi:hypothetical protein
VGEQERFAVEHHRRLVEVKVQHKKVVTNRTMRARVQAAMALPTHAPRDVLDSVIRWTLAAKQKGPSGMAQRTWKIEARMDFKDQEKNDEIDKVVKRLAVVLEANLSLLADGQKPEVICHSDDFFGRHVDIDLWGKEIPADTLIGLDQQDQVSDEMLEAMRDLNAKK